VRFEKAFELFHAIICEGLDGVFADTYTKLAAPPPLTVGCKRYL
jgi:hypothetical protein